MSQSTHAHQTVQNWGNSLGIRLTSKVAKAAHIVVGQELAVEVVEGGILLRIVGKSRESLAQKLARFDSLTHGGEMMSDASVGLERL